MSISSIKIAVIGAGIGGLAAARALALRGADVTVLEQAAEIDEVGAGLQISPNGFAVLRALDLGDAIAERSMKGQGVQLLDYRGRDVVRLDLSKLDDAKGYYFVHRADLIDVLAGGARAAGVKIRLLQKVEHVVAAQKPEIHFANGAMQHADLIVGADGLHSRLRPVLNTKAAPFFTGQVAWRATVPNRFGFGSEVRLFMGPKRHLVSYPLRDGELINLVAIQERRTWADEGWQHRDNAQNLRAAFADFCPEAQDLLRDVQNPGLWGLFRHPVAETWVGKGMALVGDAAHPTLPFMAQGANMALEDAWVLAEQLSRGADISNGLAAYQAMRKPRVKRVIAAANGNAWKYHLSFGPMRFAAHSVLRLGAKIAPERLLHQFDWIYDHDVTAQ